MSDNVKIPDFIKKLIDDDNGVFDPLVKKAIVLEKMEDILNNSGLSITEIMGSLEILKLDYHCHAKKTMSEGVSGEKNIKVNSDDLPEELNKAIDDFIESL